MGLFSKKKTVEMDLPPPPPSELQNEDFQDFEMPPIPNIDAVRKKGDLPFIDMNETTSMQDLPELPPLPSEDMYANIPEEEAVTDTEQPQKIIPLPEKPQRKEVPLREKPRPAPEIPVTKHLFVSVQDYQNVYDNVNAMKEKIIETDTILIQMHTIKKQQEEILQQWSKYLEAAQQKISYIDEMLFAGE